MKQGTASRLFRFAFMVGSPLALFGLIGGWKWLSEAMVDKVSAAIAAVAFTLILACYWALSGRSSDEFRRAGTQGVKLFKNGTGTNVGPFVRVLCGLVALLAATGAIFFVGLGSWAIVSIGRAAGMRGLFASLHALPMFWPAIVFGAIGCILFAVAFGYLALSDRARAPKRSG